MTPAEILVQYAEGKYWTDDEVENALRCLNAGGLILVKGDIGYGLFGTSEAAIRKMYALKGRPYSNPCIFIGSLEVMDEIATMPHPKIREWIERTAMWTTCAVVLPARLHSRLLRTLPLWVHQQSVINGTVAIFLRTGPYIDVIVRSAYEEGWVFVGSSANPSFQGNIFYFDEIPKGFVTSVDYYVNHGKAGLVNPQRLATTIVNFTNWSIQRRGVHWEHISRDFEELKTELNVAGATAADGGA